ncbi:MAG TPA: ABATE domain-containing protein, partial [Solirubrobacteraceae bacterium]
MERSALIEASVQPDGREPAPPGLALVQAFVNTVDAEHGPDLLDTPAGLQAWLQHRGLAAAGGATEAGLGVAREVREALRTLLRAHAGPPPPGDPVHAGAVRALDAAAERA